MFTDAGRRKAARKRRGHHLSAATKKKISRALKGKHHPHKGHKQSKATRAKISKALKGKKHPHKGHAIGAKQRAAMNAGLRAYWQRRRAQEGNGKHQTMGRSMLLRRRPISAIPGSLTNASVLDIIEHRHINGPARMTNHRKVVRRRRARHH